MRALVLSLVLLSVSGVRPAQAVDAITGASPARFETGAADAAVWITGRGFADLQSLAISGDGITELSPPEVVLQADRMDGGLGDGLIYHFSVAADAPLGPRAVTVQGAAPEPLQRFALLEIIQGAGGPPDPPPPDAGPPDAGGPVDPPEPADAGPGAGAVDVVSRASPGFGEQGDQVNLWVVGRSFQPGAQLSFSNPDITTAQLDGVPLPTEVVRAAPSEGGAADGIQYYARIAVDAAPGLVDIIVTNPDGSTATGAGLFEILEPGQAPRPQPGQGDVDSITGASPRVARAGRSVPLWIWGKGFQPGATVRFSSGSLQPFAPPEVVQVSQSHPGFSGLRNFLFVDPTALPGPVSITVTNPNGSQATAEGLFELADADGNRAPGLGGAGGAGGVGAGGPDGPCPDVSLRVGAVLSVAPAEIARGATEALVISGRDFACGAAVRIPGGGLSAEGAPQLSRDVGDSRLTTLRWTISAADDAATGPRDLTVINPDGSEAKLEAAFQITRAAHREGGVACCAARPGGPAPAALWLWLGALALWRRRR